VAVTEPVCAIEGCGKGGKLVHGLCRNHYQRWRRYGDPLAGRTSPSTTGRCTVAGCSAPHEAAGLCNRHYLRQRTHGDPMPDGVAESNRGLPLAERFALKVDIDGPTPIRRPELGPCAVWTGAKDGKGYGLIFHDGKSRRAHRVAWLLAGLSFVTDRELDHLCNNRACVRIDHLEQVTSAENVRRATEHLRWLRSRAS
jgi:hypothetical protein